MQHVIENKRLSPEEMMERILQQLGNMEKTIDELRSAMIQMARTEQQVATLIEQNSVLFKKLDDAQGRITQLEKDNISQGKSLDFFERLGWIGATALVGLVSYFFKQ